MSKLNNSNVFNCHFRGNIAEPGCYHMHSPSSCRLRFPPDHKPIHKCELPQKEVMMVPQGSGFRPLLVPRKGKNLYPAILPKNEFDRLKDQAKQMTSEQIRQALVEAERRTQQAAADSEARKNALVASAKPQPGAGRGATEDDELKGPDQAKHTVDRAQAMRADDMQGPRLANQVILASKCHAIRDAQIKEKELIKHELSVEEMRLDKIMEENRVAAVEKAKREEGKRRESRMKNLASLKRQITMHETAKIMEAERIEEESIRVNQANIALQLDEAEKLRKKKGAQCGLKEMLDKCSNELMYYRQLQNEEDRLADARVAAFLRARGERERRNREEAAAMRAAKEKGIEHIAKAQKAEQELKEELDRIRNLKIAEDVEREYRRRERAAALKRRADTERLHLARSRQIEDIHRLIAREIAKDEMNFAKAAAENEEFLAKEREAQEKHAQTVEKHRQGIMKQINDKEKHRTDERLRRHAEREALRMEEERRAAQERAEVRARVHAMREQRVPEPYVREVEQVLRKHKYL